MFGQYFGNRYYGDTYFGPGADSGPPPAPGSQRKLPIVLPLGIGRMVAQLGGLITSKCRRTDLGSS